MAREGYLGSDKPRAGNETRVVQRRGSPGWSREIVGPPKSKGAMDYMLDQPRKEEPRTSRTPVVPVGRSHTPTRLPQLDLPRDAYPDSPMLGAPVARRDPRVPEDLGDPEIDDPYGIAGGRGFTQGGPMDGPEAHATLQKFVNQTIGMGQDQAAQLSLDEIQSLIERYDSKNPRLREALGVMSTIHGMVPEDPSAGPGMRFVPDKR